MTESLQSVSLTRPWHWGIAIASDVTLGGQIPDVDPEARVSANENGLVVLVRHAQDTEAVAEQWDDAIAWADATLYVTYWSDGGFADREFLAFDGVLATPSGRLFLGDADSDIAIPCPRPESRVKVWTDDETRSPRQVWVDLW